MSDSIWDHAQVFLHDHAEGEECNSRCFEVPPEPPKEEEFYGYR